MFYKNNGNSQSTIVIRSIFWIFLSLVLTTILWEILAYVLNSPLLPTARKVGQVLLKVLIDPSVYAHLWASFFLVLQGYVLSVLIALPTSLLCFRMKIFSQIVLPTHEFIRYIPVPAFVPLCVALFGVDDTTKIALIFIGTYFQLVFLFIADLLSIPREFEESAYTLGLKGLKLINTITLRASMADILNTSRIAFAWAWSYLLVAEVVNARRGIGYLVLQSYRVLNMERLIALLIVIGIFGILTDNLFKLGRRYICPWLKYEK